ncbi:TPA: FliM/FliN family flagellar motor switch protein [Escherichia fergusonii]|uniref:FliM/FliN family flagellar motor switch protein n=1 Tax=Escherichia fergusonii TaxID=564 RepID=UPI000F67D88B|nr:FliM/FliN family flagellar motor switch protein [Escherichia fergusonii]EHG5995780.1 hypothetical protein [Escherichia fergusonii]MBA8502680.1 FliM/FliN family flagellar motor switch protein [Escherichia fergusonii]QCZ33121.1 hypothetical protein D8Z79_015475 [Escherichia fergusonii]HAI1303487.1 hypothetical protein [Escherichia fergusonii]HCO8232349.1 FliM/FliN family flagellar motor switch protein [Escherichia fergusonii]
MLGLRKVNEAEYLLNRAIGIWRTRGIDVNKGILDVGAKWTSVRDANHRWKGWIQTRELIATAEVCTGDLALTPEVEALIIEWMNQTGSLPGLHVDELTESKLIFGDRQDLLLNDVDQMVRIQTPIFTLWLEHLNIKLESPGVDIINAGMKWRVDFVLGQTVIRTETLSKTGNSDLLLIKDVRSYAACFNQKLFLWSYPEGKMTSINDEFNSINEYEEDILSATGDEITELRNIPVKLEFILHSDILTLAGLEGIYSGQMYSFPDSVEKRIEIRANGKRIGEGELVDYDGMLAVEVHQWMGDNNVE